MTHGKLVNIAYVLILASVLLFSLVPAIYSFPFAPHEESASTRTEQRKRAQVQPVTRSPRFVEPIIRRSTIIDKDSDGIQDSLEDLATRVLEAGESGVLPVVVTLFNPVSDRDLDWFESLGGHVTQIYQYVTYGFAGVIPAPSISRFADLEEQNLCVIEEDVPIQYHLDVSVPLVRARPTVWNTYGYMGSDNNSIAIIDTGIDDSHTDIGPYGNLNFSKKIVGWYDATLDNAALPQDFGEHGTHCAGIAAGTGTARNLQGAGYINTTFTYILPPKPPGPKVYGYVDYMDVLNPGVINLNCSWNGANRVLLALDDPAGNEVKRISETTKPLILTYDTTGTYYPTGRYRVFVGNAAGPAGTPFSCREIYPYQGQDDAYNLFTGVAPNSKLVGVKVFDNTGTGYLSNLTAGMDWVVQNRFTYHIVVASMSLSLMYGAVNSTIDQKADTMVKNGIVTIVSAGNDFPDYTIASPGTAAYVITVAATNDQNGITSYSSNGDIAKNEYGLVKPDVTAPGGTFDPAYGNKIISADSNDVDAAYSGYADRDVNDYQQMAGTSMSAPHVAGLAALIAQGLGDWNWTLEDALKVKMLVSMTAFETQSGEEGNLPTLDRGGKDSVEGYGRVSADAAIEAATMSYIVGENASDTLGADPLDKKVWSRRVSLSAGTSYLFNLSVPAGADYDLYIYNCSSDDYGQPVVLEKSINASLGIEEALRLTPTNSETHYVLVRWVSGSGAFNLTSMAEVHDVKVVNVEATPTKIFSGQIVNISVVVKNEGTMVETFEVTAYRNETLIGAQTVVDLASNASTTLTFYWNTTGVSSGAYLISATAEQVWNELDLLDNLFEDGWVKVSVAFSPTGGSGGGRSFPLFDEAR